MKNLINAAMTTAKREGMTGAVILFGQNGANASTLGTTAEETSLDDLQEALGRAAAAEEEIDQLRAALANQNPDAGPLQQEVARLQGLLTAAEDRVKGLTEQISAPPLPAGGEAPPMNTEVVDLAQMSIDLLGLDPKTLKGVQKVAQTVGAARDAYMADAVKFKADTKLTKDQVIEFGVALAGKLPSLSAHQAAGSVGSGTVGPTVASVQGTAPLADRAWPDRYTATLTKEVRMKEEEAAVAQLRAEAQAANPAAVVNGSLDLSKLPVQTADTIRLREGAYNVVRGQVIAGMWHCGLNPTAGTLVAALEQAGVTPTVLEGLKDSQGNALVWPAAPVGAAG